jgi:tripartite-type tricarboxylate transporter receptor subunit TctC
VTRRQPTGRSLTSVSSKTLPANDLNELITWLKANPGKASAGNAGIGTASHVGAVFFQRETGTRLQLLPYRGRAPATQDLLGGRTGLRDFGPGE